MFAAFESIFYLYPVTPVKHYFAVVAACDVSDLEHGSGLEQ